jgi:hypothetical protein
MIFPAVDFSRCSGSGERETTPKDHCRQAEIARKLVTFWRIRHGTGPD